MPNLIKIVRNTFSATSAPVGGSFTVAYVAALTLIAVLSIVTHTLLDRVIVANEGSAHVINVAGRQRMLSQRIGFYATDYGVTGRVEALQPLRDAIDLMARSHAQLSSGALASQTGQALSPKMEAFYRAAPAELDRRVDAFIADARRVADARDPAALARVQIGASADVLQPLDAAVHAYEAESSGRTAELRDSQRLVLYVIFATLFAEALLIFRPLARRLTLYAGQLYEFATRDVLTGLFNRRATMEALGQAFGLARRGGHPLAVLACDIDHFKKINDTLGHAAGDQALRRFAEIARDTLRTTDMVGRVGGEEFMCVLANTSLDGALVVAGKLRAAIAAQTVRDDAPFRISVGVAALSVDDFNVAALLDRADQGLYGAKRSGRDRVMPAPLAAALA